MGMELWLAALLWGSLAGSALVLGAFLGYFINISQRIVAGIMAFGSGVLISALSLELMEDAYSRGGFDSTAVGFLSGALIFTVANWMLSKSGGKHRKRAAGQQPSEKEKGGSGLAIAVGSLLDGIPESIVIGLSLIAGGKVSVVAVCAVFLSNVPEGLSSTAGMKKAGRSKLYIFGIWLSIALACGFASLIGYSSFRHFSDEVITSVTAVAAGAILAMIVDTMLPEAYETTARVQRPYYRSGFSDGFFSKPHDLAKHFDHHKIKRTNPSLPDPST